MGEGNKIAIALVFMCVPLGCTAPGQEATEITCVDSDGKIFYTGSYIEERSNGYLVQLDERTEAFFPKGPCHKMPA